MYECIANPQYRLIEVDVKGIPFVSWKLTQLFVVLVVTVYKLHSFTIIAYLSHLILYRTRSHQSRSHSTRTWLIMQ